MRPNWGGSGARAPQPWRVPLPHTGPPLALTSVRARAPLGVTSFEAHGVVKEVRAKLHSVKATTHTSKPLSSGTPSPPGVRPLFTHRANTLLLVFCSSSLGARLFISVRSLTFTLSHWCLMFVRSVLGARFLVRSARSLLTFTMFYYHGRP